ncbi:sigma-70 family RNA polymerase sigma factor [Luteolibacter algae]|uniref:Sigma-70 family RNA polymerase sigma factor n=1 Tax=Luteolibacter algae TaxID=454151 RepID=A0ABW5D3G4_9BACT
MMSMDQDREREGQFLQIFLRNEEDLKCYARALLPSWEAVDDVMQEVSLIVWRKMDQLRDPSEFLPWAKVIVRFECLKARRTVARDRHWFSDEVFELLADHEFDPDEDLLTREREALESCLGKMDKAQRELVLLPYRGHGGVSQLADETGRPANALYKKIRRLREKLTQCVCQQLAGPGLEGGRI